MRSSQFCEEWQEAHDECIEVVGAPAVLEMLVQEVGLKTNSLDDIHRVDSKTVERARYLLVVRIVLDCTTSDPSLHRFLSIVSRCGFYV